MEEARGSGLLCTASNCVLALALQHQSLSCCAPGLQEQAAQLADFCRKCAVLAGAQHQAGDLAGALGSLGNGVALLLRLGFAQPTAWLPLVEAFVGLQCEAAQQQEAVVQEVSEAPQPARRGRGAGSKRAAGSAAASGSSAAGSRQASGGDVLLIVLLQQHEAGLPSGGIAAVLKQELLCWGAALQDNASAQPAVIATAASRVVHRLLHEAFPAKPEPVRHATVLLALHQAGLPADDGQRGLALLERAVAAMSKVGPVEGVFRAAPRLLCLPLHVCVWSTVYLDEEREGCCLGYGGGPFIATLAAGAWRGGAWSAGAGAVLAGD